MTAPIERFPVSAESHYTLLGINPNASDEEVKRAFRQQIARYHPDKVQHLGTEFQELAAERAAELTHAYTVLSDPGRRAEYDRARQDAPAPAAARPSSHAGRATERPVTPSVAAAETSSSPNPPPDAAPRGGSQFAQERASRDELVRRALIGRFRQAVASAAPRMYDESQVASFHVACVPKAPTLFRRAKGPRLLGQFVSRVDGPSIANAWEQAGKWLSSSSAEVCVFLIGSTIAPARELAEAIADQRRKGRAPHVTVIPVDARDWQAHVPTGAPALAKRLIAQLQGSLSR